MPAFFLFWVEMVLHVISIHPLTTCCGANAMDVVLQLGLLLMR